MNLNIHGSSAVRTREGMEETINLLDNDVFAQMSRRTGMAASRVSGD